MADSTRLMIYRNLLSSIAEEMGVVLKKTSYSPNIKERRDYSCALFDRDGRLVAQAAHIPVHLGSFSPSIRAAIETIRFEPGDTVALNDPFRGGTHLPDISLIRAVFLPGNRSKPSFFVANRAHHSDVGGIAPGSMAPATEVAQEGLRIPPVRLLQNGSLNQEILSLILANVRTPAEREGDLRAQIAANAIGERRLLELVRRKGKRELDRATKELLAHSERMMRSALRSLGNATASFEDAMDDDGAGTKDIPIRVEIRIRGDRAVFDFTGTSPQVDGCVNATSAVTTATVQYALCAAIGEDIPVNEGILAPVEIIAPIGTVANARFPAATAAGNVETSQRLVDTVLGALAKILPDKIPAASCGSMNNLTIGGIDPRTGRPFSYYETIAGGSGASPDRDGTSGVQTHMTNTLNTPIESLEIEYPFRVVRSSLRPRSGGKGRYRGGDGIIREIEIQAKATVGLLTERRRLAPYGLKGGSPGKSGRNLLRRRRNRRFLPLKAKAIVEVNPGDVIRIETPGGGGHGKATKRKATSNRSKNR